MIKNNKVWGGRQVMRTLSALTLLAATAAVAAKDLPGGTETSYGVSQSGAFQFSIPVVTPVGVNGVQPNISLSFSSDRGNGPAGVGWRIAGFSSITRCAKTIATHGEKKGSTHSSSDRFCLDGKPLIPTSHSWADYGKSNTFYRTEIDNIARVQAIGTGSVNINGGRSPDRWEVRYKNGMIYEYGNNLSSKFKLPGTSSIHSWKVSKVRNREGSNYAVTYRSADGHPHDVIYGDGHRVLFNYVARSDVRTRWVAGKKFTYNQRLKSIVVSRNNTAIRTYNLGYQYGAVSKKSKLNWVQECGLNNECMPKIDIDWRADNDGFEEATLAGDKAPAETFSFDSTSSNLNKEITHGQWADLNGDGEVDQVIAVQLPNGTIDRRSFIKVNGQWQQQNKWRLPKPLRTYWHGITASNLLIPKVVNQGQLVDVNGDGLVDVVYATTYKYQHNSTETLRETYLNTGDGWTAQPDTGYRLPDFIFSYVDNAGVRQHSNGTSQYASYIETIRGRFVDVNGDGLVDWVRAYHQYNVGYHQQTWLNTGSGWAVDSNYDLPDVFAEYRGEYSINHGVLLDVNGDGLVDWLQAYEDNATRVKHQNVWLNTGTGFSTTTAPAVYNLPDVMFENIGSWAYPRTRGSFVDLNGDGLRDFLLDSEGGTPGNGYTKSRLAYINTGRGWQHDSNYNAPFLHKDHTYIGHDWGVAITGYYIDVNRDGLTDYVQSFKHMDTNRTVSKNTWVNTGVGWQQDNSLNTNWLFFDYSGRENAKVRYGDFIDINSDGSLDWIRSRGGDAPISKINRLSKIDLLEKVTTTMGVEILPSFLTLTHDDEIYTKIPEDTEGNPVASAADAFWVEAPICVVAELRTTAPDGSGYNLISYSYAGAQIHRKGRGYLGFREMYTTDEQRGLTTFQEFNQTFPYVGTLAKSAVMRNAFTSNPHTLSLADNTWATKTITHANGESTKFPHLSYSISEAYGFNYNSARANRTRKWFTYDKDYGNLKWTRTLIDDEIEVTLADHRATRTYHPADTNSWQVGRLASESNNSYKPGYPSSNTKTTYPVYNSNGRLKQMIREPDRGPELKLTTNYHYDSAGNLANETQTAGSVAGRPAPAPRTNWIGYDTAKRLPTTLSNAAGHVSRIIEYHPQCDLPTITEDANGLRTTTQYDNFCRTTQVTSPDQVTATTEYLTTGLGCNSCQLTPEFKIRAKTAGSAAVTVYYNSYLQALASATSGMIGEPILQLTNYNELGLVAEESQPFFNDGTDQAQWTSYSYDDLDRLVETVLPYQVGGVQARITKSYWVDAAGLSHANTWEPEAHKTDPKTHITRTYTNAAGQIVRILDSGGTLKHSYNAQGLLAQTEDHYGNVIDINYDRLGRRIALDDPDLGMGSFVYNAFGELLQQTDAKGNTLNMYYDKLSRLVQRVVPGPASEGGGTSNWVYDTAPRAGGVWKGYLAQSNGPNGYTQVPSFDNYGRPVGATTTINGEQFTQSVSYDANGFLRSRTYPSSGGNKPLSVYYNYVNGYLHTITNGAVNDPNCVEHWRAEKYDALGRTKTDVLGKIVQSSRNYKPGQGVLQSIQSELLVGATQLVQDLNYTYDLNNNVKSRADSLIGLSQTFTYDRANRLISTEDQNGSIVNVNINAIGNITYKSDVGTYQYPAAGSARPHAVSRVNATPGLVDPLAKFQVDWQWNGETVTQAQPQIHNVNYQYDANGNITHQGNRRVYWTAFDKPYAMIREGRAPDTTQRGSLIEYGPDLQRIRKVEGEFSGFNSVLQTVKETTVYIGKDYERITNANGTKHRYSIAAGSNMVQIERADGSDHDEVAYMLTDALGSTNVVLDANGEVQQRMAFDPWGMRLNVGNFGAVNEISNKGFTGHEMDDELGLVNMNARIYDPLLGRFLSPDPVLQDPYNMQSYNRYSYVWNNPLKHTDPTGNCVDACATAFGVGVVTSFLNFAFYDSGDRFDDFEGDIHNLGDVLNFLYDGNIPEGDFSNEDSGFDEVNLEIAAIINTSGADSAAPSSAGNSGERGDSNNPSVAIPSQGHIANTGKDNIRNGNGRSRGLNRVQEYTPPNSSCFVGGCSLFDENGNVVLYAGGSSSRDNRESYKGTRFKFNPRGPLGAKPWKTRRNQEAEDALRVGGSLLTIGAGCAMTAFVGCIAISDRVVNTNTIISGAKSGGLEPRDQLSIGLSLYGESFGLINPYYGAFITIQNYLIQSALIIDGISEK